MKKNMIFAILLTCFLFNNFPHTVSGEAKNISSELLRDKIRGGLLGQILGNLNGLEHEMKYINEPGNVEVYTPSLDQGAWTDDDTDFEWVYVKVMQDENCVFLPQKRIAQLWKERINKNIWCSNLFARQLMDINIQPPFTGMVAFNPWAEFNISGQFICETFGLMCPGMPNTASRLGLNFTRVTIDGEPAQTTQLFTSMISLAFFENNINTIIDNGLLAIDPNSKVYRIVKDVQVWSKQYPNNWRKTRSLLKEKYSKYDGAMRDRNGYELNTGSTIAALLYGQGDFVKTLITAFNFGWDADNSAATAGTIVGVIKGYRWILSQEWKIVDRYKNTSRQNMPNDETITSFADRIIDLSEKIIIEQGGNRESKNLNFSYQIQTEKVSCIQNIQNIDEQISALKTNMEKEIRQNIRLGESEDKMVKSAYYAICLDFVPSLKKDFPENWTRSLELLNQRENILQAIFYHSPVPLGDILRDKAIKAGLKKPDKERNLW